jgi:hypothetical protein
MSGRTAVACGAGRVYHLSMSRLNLREVDASDDEPDVTPVFPELEDEVILED